MAATSTWSCAACNGLCGTSLSLEGASSHTDRHYPMSASSGAPARRPLRLPSGSGRAPAPAVPRPLGKNSRNPLSCDFVYISFTAWGPHGPNGCRPVPRLRVWASRASLCGLPPAISWDQCCSASMRTRFCDKTCKLRRNLRLILANSILSYVHIPAPSLGTNNLRT